MSWHNVRLYVNANLPIHVCYTGGPQSLHIQHFPPAFASDHVTKINFNFRSHFVYLLLMLLISKVIYKISCSSRFGNLLSPIHFHLPRDTHTSRYYKEIMYNSPGNSCTVWDYITFVLTLSV